MPPCQIVPTLADEGVYIASESIFYRVLKKEKMLNHRGLIINLYSRDVVGWEVWNDESDGVNFFCKFRSSMIIDAA